MRYICAIFAVLMISTLCYSQTSPNMPPDLPSAALLASPNTPPAQPSLTPSQPSAQSSPAGPNTITMQSTTLNSDEAIRAERDAYKQVVEAHQKTLDTIKWAIGIIGSLIVILVGYIAFKNNKEYKDALEQAKESKNDAKEACKEARHWESEAKQIFDSIDKQVKAELEKVKEQGKESIEQIEKQSNKSLVEIFEKQRINTLWSTALRLDREGKHEEVGKIFEELDKLVKDNAAYNQACQYALWGNKERCRKWLLVGQEAGTLVTRDIAMKDRDLDSVRDEPWFKEIKWEGE